MKIGFSLHNIHLKHELTMSAKQSLFKSMILYLFLLTIFYIFRILCQCIQPFVCVCAAFFPFFLNTHSLNHFSMEQFVRRMESLFFHTPLNGIHIWYSTFVDTKKSDLPNAFRFNYCHLIKWNSTTHTIPLLLSESK